MNFVRWAPVAVLLMPCALHAQDQPPASARAAPAGSPRSLRIADVLQSALRGPQVAAAEARVRAAQASVSAARALPNPILSWQTENGPYPGAQRPLASDRETSLLATLPLEFLYQRGPQVTRAQQQLSAASAELTSARWTTALEALRAFARVLMAQAALDAATDLRSGLGDLVTFNETRVREGAAPEGELLRAAVERDRAALEEALAEAELTRAWADLRPFVPDAAAPAPPRLLVDAAALPPLPALSTLVDESRRRQPQVLAARARVEAQRAAVAYQHRLPLRQLGATFGNKRVAGESTMTAALSLALPLFDRNRAGVARADAERVAAEQELLWIERTAAAQVDAAYRAAELLRARVAAIAPDIVARAEESRRIALAAYREGAGSLLQVLDAARAVSDARQTWERALLARQASLVHLQAAVGGDPLSTITSVTDSGEQR